MVSLSNHAEKLMDYVPFDKLRVTRRHFMYKQWISTLPLAAERGVSGESREIRELPRNCKGNESRKRQVEV